MKKYFEYIGLIALTLFSFYYTDKVTKIMNNKDPIMVSIKEYNEKNKESCTEGYYTNDGVILGVSGKVVNISESYSNMVGNQYDEDLLVYEKVSCKVNKENTIDNYIIKGNDIKNSVSIFIELKDLSLIKSIINISSNHNIKVNLLVDGKLLENNKEYLKELYLNNYDLVYNGTISEDLKLYNKLINSFDKDNRRLCMSYLKKDNLNICKKEKLNTIRTEYIYDKNIYINTKSNLEKGGFYIFKENDNTLREFNSLINYIKGKKLNIISISEMLK